MFVTSLLEDHEGTVWAGILAGSTESPAGRLCAIRSGQRDSATHRMAPSASFVWSLSEDQFRHSVGRLPSPGFGDGSPDLRNDIATPGVRIDDLNKVGRWTNLLIADSVDAGLSSVVGDKLETVPYSQCG